MKSIQRNEWSPDSDRCNCEINTTLAHGALCLKISTSQSKKDILPDLELWHWSKPSMTQWTTSTSPIISLRIFQGTSTDWAYCDFSFRRTFNSSRWKTTVSAGTTPSSRRSDSANRFECCFVLFTKDVDDKRASKGTRFSSESGQHDYVLHKLRGCWTVEPLGLLSDDHVT